MKHTRNTESVQLMKRPILPERILALGFLMMIVLGGVLLSLPCAAANGQSIGLGRAMFTSASAVCVTGLIVVDTGTAFSLFGQLVLLLLIQLGGLGFMVFATLIMAAFGKRITLRSRVLIRESMNTTTLAGLVRLTGVYGLLALGIELTGAVLLSTRFVPLFGWGKGLYFSIWHAVSAFCNAGFDLFGDFSSLTSFAQEPIVLLTIAVLIIMGGIGFAVILEMKEERFRWDGLSLHTKMVLTVTIVLLLAGTVFYAVAEWGNARTLGSVEGVGNKLTNAFFQSATMRTAGFNSVDLSGMGDAAKFVSILLMFIGASPASTGGGIKTTTVTVLVLAIVSEVRGRKDINLWHRRMPQGLLRRALAVTGIAAMVLMVGTMIVVVVENGRYSFLDLLFETTSACATVGVSSVGTPQLKLLSQAMVVPMMYFGRVGPLTLALALAKRQDGCSEKIRYPEENVPIG